MVSGRLVRMNGGTAYHVENEAELDAKWVRGLDAIGLIGGTSTPMETLLAVKERKVGVSGNWPSHRVDDLPLHRHAQRHQRRQG